MRGFLRGVAISTVTPPRASAVGARWPLRLALAALLTILAGLAWDHWRAPSAPAPDPWHLHPAFGPADYPAALAAADGKVASARRSLADGPGEWLRMEILARALASRFRLSADPGDAVEADALLDLAIAAAPTPSGPNLARAGLSLTLHDLAGAEAALARFDAAAVPNTAANRADALGLRGDIAMQRGDLAGAAVLYAKARGLSDTPGLMLRAGTLAARRGDFGTARRLADAALAVPRQQPAALSDLALGRAAIAYAEGDWPAAQRWIAAADRVFPGRWLTRAWTAQGLALRGDPDGAIRAYSAVATETQQPEVLDALAHLLRLQGNRDASRKWSERSARLWSARLAVLEPAYAAHAAEHELAVGDPARALALLRAEAARRPYGQVLVPLARAETLSGNPQAALASLDRAQRQGWRTELLHIEKAAALEALGRGDEANAERRAAAAINPRITDPAALALWFGHD